MRSKHPHWMHFEPPKISLFLISSSIGQMSSLLHYPSRSDHCCWYEMLIHHHQGHYPKYNIPAKYSDFLTSGPWIQKRIPDKTVLLPPLLCLEKKQGCLHFSI